MKKLVNITFVFILLHITPKFSFAIPEAHMVNSDKISSASNTPLGVSHGKEEYIININGEDYRTYESGTKIGQLVKAASK